MFGSNDQNIVQTVLWMMHRDKKQYNVYEPQHEKTNNVDSDQV